VAVEGKDHLSFPLFAGKAWGRPKLLSNASILLSPYLHFPCHLPSSLTNPTMLLLLSFLNLMLSVRVVSAACYDFNFNLNTPPGAQPCNNIVGRISMCCNTNLSTSDFLTRPTTCLHKRSLQEHSRGFGKRHHHKILARRVQRQGVEQSVLLNGNPHHFFCE
jgi:hypothetical protein